MNIENRTKDGRILKRNGVGKFFKNFFDTSMRLIFWCFKNDSEFNLMYNVEHLSTLRFNKPFYDKHQRQKDKNRDASRATARRHTAL